jgi:hypothetical protein
MWQGSAWDAFIHICVSGMDAFYPYQKHGWRAQRAMAERRHRRIPRSATIELAQTAIRPRG